VRVGMSVLFFLESEFKILATGTDFTLWVGKRESSFAIFGLWVGLVRIANVLGLVRMLV